MLIMSHFAGVASLPIGGSRLSMEVKESVSSDQLINHKAQKCSFHTSRVSHRAALLLIILQQLNLCALCLKKVPDVVKVESRQLFSQNITSFSSLFRCHRFNSQGVASNSRRAL